MGQDEFNTIYEDRSRVIIGEHLFRLDLFNYNLSGYSIIDCIIEECDFHRAFCEKTNFTDTMFKNCINLSMAEFINCNMKYVTYINTFKE